MGIIEGEIGGYFPSGDKDATVGIGLGSDSFSSSESVKSIHTTASCLADLLVRGAGTAVLERGS